MEGLKKHLYQLAILHTQPRDEAVFFRKYFDEHLYISLPAGHPLADRKSVSFQDLKGMSILAHGNAGFWVDICQQNLADTKLLVQDSMEVLNELVEASSLPVFHSDLARERGYQTAGRVMIPIDDRPAHATYYLACLESEKARFAPVFCAVQSKGTSVEGPS